MDIPLAGFEPEQGHASTTNGWRCAICGVWEVNNVYHLCAFQQPPQPQDPMFLQLSDVNERLDRIIMLLEKLIKRIN